MNNRILGSSPAFALAAAMAFMPGAAIAQTPPTLTPPASAMCVGDLSPASVEAGVKAVAVTVEVSEMMGAVTGIETGEDSGISMAIAADLPKTEMARPVGEVAAAAQLITMAEAANTWTIWLNVAEAEAGSHDVTFTSSAGNCTAHLLVKPAA